MRAWDLRHVIDQLVLAERGSEPLALLLRLFAASDIVPVESAAALGLDIDGLIELDVLRRNDDRLTSTVRIDEMDGVLVMSDRDPGAPDYVAAVSPSTRLSYAFTPQVDVDRMLDIGTGSGAHALAAAKRSGTVVATDFNPRACALTRMNAALNGITNVETREGSFFEPVAGEKFGLAVVNPPYVISPDGGFMYRDAGLEGDELSRTLLRELPDLLDEGGWATLQGNWIHGADDQWYWPIGRCLAGSGCDAWVVRITTDTPRKYAVKWVEPDHLGDPAAFRDRMVSWVESYRAMGIERITGAVVVLRKRSDAARNWRRACSIVNAPEGLNARLPELAATQDRLEAAGATLDGALLRAADDLWVERYSQLGGKTGYAVESASTPATRRPVTAAAAQLIESLGAGMSISGVDDELARELVRLVKSGYLEYAD
jgi:SAM-dependent methyltransferase